MGLICSEMPAALTSSAWRILSCRGVNQNRPEKQETKKQAQNSKRKTPPNLSLFTIPSDAKHQHGLSAERDSQASGVEFKRSFLVEGGKVKEVLVGSAVCSPEMIYISLDLRGQHSYNGFLLFLTRRFCNRNDAARSPQPRVQSYRRLGLLWVQVSLCSAPSESVDYGSSESIV